MEEFKPAGKLGSNNETIIRARPLAGMDDKPLKKKTLYFTAKERLIWAKGRRNVIILKPFIKLAAG